MGACAQETGHPTLAVPSDCSHRHLECQQHVEEAQAHAWGQQPCTGRRGVAAAGLSTARLGPRGEASSERAPPPHPHTRPQPQRTRPQSTGRAGNAATRLHAGQAGKRARTARGSRPARWARVMAGTALEQADSCTCGGTSVPRSPTAKPSQDRHGPNVSEKH